MALVIHVSELYAQTGDDCNANLPCYTNVSPSEYEDFPYLYIKLAFHFVAQDYGDGPVNFQCEDTNEDFYAPDYVQALLDFANNVLKDPEQSNQTMADDLPDLRLRYIPEHGYDDLCKSIFFHASSPTLGTLSDDVMNIILRDGDPTGQVLASHALGAYNVHYKAFVLELPPTHQDYRFSGRVITHELGHILGLCHAHSTTTCPEIDTELECGNGVSATSCSGDNTVCIWNNSNNVMANGVLTAFVHSQWAYFYHHLLNQNYTFISISNDFSDCNEVSSSPLEIESNTIEEWNCPLYLDKDIEIRAGATLIISTQVTMSKNKRIIVNRGGRLFVNGGSIYGESPTCRWGGILVHGKSNVAQPDIEDAKNKYHTLTSSDAGVVWLKDAAIYWANTGIATKGSGTLSTHDYFGGLVMVDNSDFIDCGRAAEFMKYDYRNKSYFDLCNITSTEEYEEISRQGITIWACRDISFQDVYFTGHRDFAVVGINFNASFESCDFTGSSSTSGSTTRYGIRSETTMPNAVIDRTVIQDCKFRRYYTDILAMSSHNVINGFEIRNNIFEEPVSQFAVGIHMRGESSFEITDINVFVDKGRSILLQSTGGNSNQIRCNYFGNNDFWSILVNGRNDRIRLLGNDFYDTSQDQVFVNGATSAASFGERHGFLDHGSGNCFANPQSAIRTSLSGTVHFDYYVYDLNGDPLLCEKPTNNLSDQGVNNYTLREASSEWTGCMSPVTPGPFVLSDLSEARDSTASKKAIYVSDPSNQAKRSAYLDATDHQDNVLRYLVREAFDGEDLDLADSLMLGEEEKMYHRAVVGLRTQRGDLAGAETVLYSIDTESQDDEWFIDIMKINFKLADADTLYLLSSEEEELMMIIAATDSSIMSGYACALLHLCAGYLCHFEPEEPEEYRIPQLPSHPVAQEIPVPVRIYPNPTDGVINVDVGELDDEKIRVELIDMTGKTVLIGQLLDPTLQIKLPAQGIYIVRVISDQQIMHVQKVVYLR